MCMAQKLSGGSSLKSAGLSIDRYASIAVRSLLAAKANLDLPYPNTAEPHLQNATVLTRALGLRHCLQMEDRRTESITETVTQLIPAPIVLILIAAGIEYISGCVRS